MFDRQAGRFDPRVQVTEHQQALEQAQLAHTVLHACRGTVERRKKVRHGIHRVRWPGGRASQRRRVGEIEFLAVEPGLFNYIIVFVKK